MWLIVGLGNPGSGYAGHRHNIGFMAVERIAQRHGFPSWRPTRFAALGSEGELAGERAMLLKPTTYMNESGQAVGAVARFFKVGLDSIWVAHDELDLAPGRLRTKRGGGAGGHNGLRSLDAHLGPDYRRVRIGIGHPGHKDLVTPWVLSNVSGEERRWLDPLLDAVADSAPLLASPDEAAFANKVTVLLQPPKPPRPPKPAPREAEEPKP